MLHIANKVLRGSASQTGILRREICPEFKIRNFSDEPDNNDKRKLPPEMAKLAKLLGNMKIDKEPSSGFGPSRVSGQETQRFRKRPTTTIIPEMEDTRRRTPEGVLRPMYPRQSRREPLYGGQPPLGIFSSDDGIAEEVEIPKEISTWERLQRESLDELLTQSPRNGFEQAIQWTEQGKLWHFPIDNEQGIDESVKMTPFYEHVMLEHHLDDGFPPDGPIRKFMENICLGLSNNPFMTVERKLAYIDWYRKYFKSKEEICKAIGMDIKTGRLPINE